MIFLAAEKTCSKCGTSKSLDQFHKDKSTKDGMQGYCITCQSLYHSQYRLENIVSQRLRNRVWIKNNPEKNTANATRYQKRKKANGGSHTEEQWQELKYQTGNKCMCCQASGDDKILQRDHVIPVSKGGTNNIDNIQVLCRECNCSKAQKEIDYR